jgi:hypothetical protein
MKEFDLLVRRELFVGASQTSKLVPTHEYPGEGMQHATGLAKEVLFFIPLPSPAEFLRRIMQYKDAPVDYPYWPSKYKPEESKISNLQNSYEPPISREDAITILCGEAAACFLDDFPKQENLKDSIERATALANYGLARICADKIAQTHNFVRRLS